MGGDIRDWILPDPLGLFGGDDKKDTPPAAAAPAASQYPIQTHVSYPPPNTGKAVAAKRTRAKRSIADTDSILGEETLGG